MRCGRYELTGGFIKNALMSALMSACARDVHSPVIRQGGARQVGCFDRWHRCM
jgi:hypothetical protein